MKLSSSSVLLFCCCVVACTYASTRIIGGKDAPDGKYPYMVSLRDADGYFCGGSIINNRWILTAAHCVLGFDSDDVKIIAGTNLIEGGEEQVYQAEYMVSHEHYNKPSFYNNDVGLIRVNEDIVFNDKVQPVKLPVEDFNNTGYPVLVTGWGIYDKSAGAKPKRLQEITLELVDQETCKKTWSQQGTQIDQSQFCMSTTPAESLCFGDSGSPVVIDGIQIGVVSLSQLCLGFAPDVAARVYHFLDWIARKQSKF